MLYIDIYQFAHIDICQQIYWKLSAIPKIKINRQKKITKKRIAILHVVIYIEIHVYLKE